MRLTAMRQWDRKRWLWLAVNIGAALPLVWMGWDWTQGNLIDPVAALTTRSGQSAIILLMLSLAVTPLVTLTGFRVLGTLRKSLGLWAFAYALLHFLVFIGLDYGFSLEFILMDGLQLKRYILVGLAALLILLPLALTSTRWAMKRLGRNWKQLHRWVYAAGALAALHYIWAAKLAAGKPTLYAAILVALLVARIPPVRRVLAGTGRRLRGQRPAPPRSPRAPLAPAGE